MRSTEIELEVEVEVDGDIVLATATVEVTGEYMPGTWGPNGGDPPEYPEAEVISLSYKTEAGEERALSLDLLTDNQNEDLTNRAIEQRDSGDYDGPDPDSDWDSRCDRDDYAY